MRTQAFILIAAVLAALVIAGEAQIRFPKYQARPAPKDVPSYQTKWYLQTLDHFNFNTQPLNFYQRYLVNDQYYKPGGPLLFYSGNEGDVVMFWNNTGFMFTLAQEFGGYIVFAEHRYYGQSLPFGQYSFTNQNISFLTVEQALADYAQLIPDLKKSIPGLANSKVITFGGSYGGMLSAWFRIKYPHIVDGALAASAPVLQFQGLVNPETFSKIVTDDYTKANPQCSSRIRDAYKQVNTLASSPGGYSALTNAFSLCSPLQNQNDIINLWNWINNAIIYMAMTDYPYPTGFLQPLPAWPVEAACVQVMKYSNVLTGLAQASGVYYNTTGDQKCFNINEGASAGLGDASWNYQACTELVLPVSSNGVNDMFLNQTWDINQYAMGCFQTYGVTIRPHWIPLWSGADKLQASSNIIFSNGELDPWRGGGIVKNIGSSIYAIHVEKGAHHLDLRSPDPRDPQGVIKARKQETEIIRGWLKQ
jgi:lysosomal Pro-X carboxypeptidase